MIYETYTSGDSFNVTIIILHNYFDKYYHLWKRFYLLKIIFTISSIFFFHLFLNSENKMVFGVFICIQIEFWLCIL